MNGELMRALEPQRAKVEAALHDLDTSNQDASAHPLDALTYTGRVIREQQALIDALTDFLDRRDPLGPECGCHVTLAIQGRLNTLAKERNH